jgi:hypothetical protein
MSISLPRKPVQQNPLKGQMTLFGGVCPEHGEVLAYEPIPRRRVLVLRCAVCDAEVTDVSCGYTE